MRVDHAGGMRRNGLLVGGWALATVLALVLSLQGIRSVSNSVTNPRPAPLSPASVKAQLQRTNSLDSAGASTDSAESRESTDDVRSSGSSVGANSVDSGHDTDGGASSSVSPAVPPVNASPAGDGSTASGSGEGSTRGDGDSSGSGSGSVESSSSSSVAPQDKTYELVGGSVGVRFENGGAHLLWATPKSGYRLDESNDDGGTVDVRF